MTTLQELITRGRFVMADAPERLRVFEAVDGRRTARDIASLTGRHENNIRRDLAKLRDVGLIQPASSRRGTKGPDSVVFEQVPLARSIPSRYFAAVARRPESGESPQEVRHARLRRGGASELAVPTEEEVLAIARDGEDQLHEFKGQRTEVPKLTREVAAMLNTSRGGIVFYGIDDHGSIEGSDLTRQQLDQPLQNSVRNAISPAGSIRLHSVSVLGSTVLVVIVPPWNRQDVYQYNEKVLIRKGTNVFGADPEELRRLHRGDPVI